MKPIFKIFDTGIVRAFDGIVDDAVELEKADLDEWADEENKMFAEYQSEIEKLPAGK